MPTTENKFYQREVYLYCPTCKEKQLVQANMIRTEYVKASVLQFPDHCEIDWDTADVAGDFEYICEMCGTKLADSMEDIENKLKETESGNV